jgi:phospholipid/cholesterol/gamma-HCH transport system ATP-binding protein
MGKSVTLKHIVGLLKPDQGEVWVDGIQVQNLGAEGLSRVRQKCGMVFQHPALLDSLSVYQNVAFGLRTPQFLAQQTSWNESDEEGRVLKALEAVHVKREVLHQKPQTISYGIQKRVSLARTLAPQPQYLLFDEPTTGLDPITTQAVNQLILELSRKLQVTSLVVSHDMGCALSIADQILVLDEGRILALGSPEEMRASTIPLVRDFLSEALELEASKGGT